MARKSISDAIKKSLFALSGNQCAFPKCKEEIYNLENKVLIGEVCHIIAVNENGPRHEIELDSESINLIENLFILCPNHHTVIDKNSAKYNSQLLRKIKLDHEKKISNALKQWDEKINGRGEVTIQELLEIEKIEVFIDTIEESPIIKELPKKELLPPLKDHIPKYIRPVNDEKNHSFENRSLEDIIQSNKQITVLGVAGSGKSIELDHLAYLYSLPNKDLYPFKIRLNTISDKESIEDVIKLNFDSFSKVPEQNLLILLDALDEVHPDHIGTVAKSISLLGKKYKEATIVVTCRNNFYTAETHNSVATIDGFKTYILRGLDWLTVNKYISDRLSKKSKLFIKLIEKTKFQDLLYSPFFLVRILEFYQMEIRIPESRKVIFDYLIDLRINEDFNKFTNTVSNLREYGAEIKKEIQKLALTAECFERNYLDEQSEVLEIVSSPQIFKMIKGTFLFNRGSNNNHRWEFEHNNFQEYLAAKYLSELGFEQIRKFISFSPNYDKIKPSWLNTVSFLFGLLDVDGAAFKNLFNWILDGEPDVLVRFEKDKIELSLRETIFKEIYESFEAKGIIIRNTKFESDDLSYFVSDSSKIIEYLLNKVEASNESLIISEAIRLFENFDSIDEHKLRIEKILLDKICNSIIDEKTKYNCLNTLASLKISSIKLTNQILTNNELELGQYYRAGLYQYLIDSDHLEDFLNILLEGISLLRELEVSGVGERKENVFAEKYNLEAAIKEIRQPESLVCILEWGVSFEKLSYFHNMFESVMRNTLEKTAPYYNEGKITDLNLVTNLLNHCIEEHYKELNDDFKNFFKATKTEFAAFKILFGKFESDKQWQLNAFSAISLIANHQCVDYLLERVRKNSLSTEVVLRVRDCLNWRENKTLFDLFYKNLQEINTEKYSYIEQFPAISSTDKRKRDLELLFSKKEFLTETLNLFEENSNSALELTQEQIYDYKKRSFNDDQMTNNIVAQVLREKCREKEFVSYKEVESLVNNNKSWTWFTLSELLKYDKDVDFIFDEKSVEFIITWINNTWKKANFKTAIRANENRFNFRYLELYLAYFSARIEISLPDEFYLDLLYLECFIVPALPSKIKDEENAKNWITNFVIEKAGLSKTNDRILENLESSNILYPVRMNHFKHCNNNNLREATNFILKEIKAENYKYYEKRDLVDYYLNLGGLEYEIIDLLDQFEQSLKIHSIDKLIIRENSSALEYCYNILESSIEEELKLDILKSLIKYDNSNTARTLNYFKDWIIRNQQLPEMRYSKQNCIEKFELEDLIEIYEDSLVNNYGGGDWDHRTEYLKEIVSAGCKNESDFLRVKGRLEYWVRNFEGVKYLFYQIPKFEDQYYSSISKTLTLKQIKKLINM
ncbi:hypothetical protein [Crocinitomix catalasitica]|uniref:hypothetical protein n=1 Tax=Crocinitomix catalasitica TaxID=184607 RepID=UPI0004874A01|nr:hypothetical protein [Crocinitomix catalasitica]